MVVRNEYITEYLRHRVQELEAIIWKFERIWINKFSYILSNFSLEYVAEVWNDSKTKNKKKRATK